MEVDRMIGENKNKFSLIIGVLASLCIHIMMLYLKLSPVTQLPKNITEGQSAIEITRLPETEVNPPANIIKPVPEIKGPKIVETEDSNNNKLDPNSKFLSDRNQVVDRQMKAKSVDDFRKQSGSGLQNKALSNNSTIPQTGLPKQTIASKNETQKLQQTKEDTTLSISQVDLVDRTETKSKKDQQPPGVKRDWKTLSMKDLSIGGDGKQSAASDDKLDGVDLGERTILSTREYRYFSYYHRIKELLRQYWKPNIENKLYHMFAKGQVIGEAEMTTRLIVMLDDRGKIKKISRTLSSGINELDEAAIEAFEKAGPFPNPPKAIIEPDGFVRITWEFILKTEAAPNIRFSNAGNGQIPR